LADLPVLKHCTGSCVAVDGVKKNMKPVIQWRANDCFKQNVETVCKGAQAVIISVSPFHYSRQELKYYEYTKEGPPWRAKFYCLFHASGGMFVQARNVLQTISLVIENKLH